MGEITKPESYKKLEKDDIGLFRQSPSTDWAPALTPHVFTRSFGDRTRSSSDDYNSERKWSSWSRGSRTTSGESDDLEPWGHFSRDASWRRWDDEWRSREEDWPRQKTWVRKDEASIGVHNEDAQADEDVRPDDQVPRK